MFATLRFQIGCFCSQILPQSKNRISYVNLSQPKQPNTNKNKPNFSLSISLSISLSRADNWSVEYWREEEARPLWKWKIYNYTTLQLLTSSSIRHSISDNLAKLFNEPWDYERHGEKCFLSCLYLLDFCAAHSPKLDTSLGWSLGKIIQGYEFLESIPTPTILSKNEWRLRILEPHYTVAQIGEKPWCSSKDQGMDWSTLWGLTVSSKPTFVLELELIIIIRGTVEKDWRGNWRRVLEKSYGIFFSRHIDDVVILRVDGTVLCSLWYNCKIFYFNRL